MELAIVGWGKMGANIARRLAQGGHRIVAYNRSPEKASALAKEEPNVEAVASLEDIATQMESPRAAWTGLAGFMESSFIDISKCLREKKPKDEKPNGAIRCDRDWLRKRGEYR